MAVSCAARCQLAWLSAGSVPVWMEAVHAMPLVGVEVEGVAEIVGAQLLENGV